MPENMQTGALQGKPTRHLHQSDLAHRWSISPRTLERWRWLGQGPQYLKIGGRVVYRLDDVEACETQQVRTSTASTAGGLSHASRG